MPASFAAVDLGATSGRVMLGTLVDGRVSLEQMSRFSHDPLPVHGALQWNVGKLFAESRAGIAAAERRSGGLSGVAVDTWAVDYALLDIAGALVEDPYNYRDARTEGVPAQVFEHIPADVLYSRCGLQVQPFNTIFQLAASIEHTAWEDARALLLIPDLFSYWLGARPVAEVTNASTTGLLDVRSRTWSQPTLDTMASVYGIHLSHILPELVEPGTVLGSVWTDVVDTRAQVVAVGSHDTASAIVAVPSETPRFAYISSGTWSLVGLELDAPVLTEASRSANFTNELGIDGTVRYLKNVMGLWVLTECQRRWEEDGEATPLQDLLDAAAALPGQRCVFDVNDASLLPPGDMPARIVRLAEQADQPAPETPAEFVRAILDSLAAAYREAVRQACDLAGCDVDVIHIVGGGSHNALLCQLTADATGLPVVAGPGEGTALGNVLVQARALGAIEGDLAALRQVVRASSELTTYTPRR